MAYLYLLTGIILLLFGGDWLVRGAVDLALRFKISVLVVGMTVVSFATSAPELLVSVNAAMDGYTDISFGNVIGSNIANISLILGLTAIVFPIGVRSKTYRIDYWIMILVTVLLFLLVYNDHLLTFFEALILVMLLIGYNIYQIWSARQLDSSADIHLEEEPEQKKKKKPFWMIFYLAIGVAGLKYGSDFLIEGAVSLAQSWGVSERIIGITVVSVGTSLPELAASMIASFKGEQELSLGNLIGSNIFNILAVLGITGLLIDLPVKSEELINFDFPFLFGISFLLYPLIRIISKGVIQRWEGGVMLLAYLVYIYNVF